MCRLSNVEEYWSGLMPMDFTCQSTSMPKDSSLNICKVCSLAFQNKHVQTAVTGLIYSWFLFI
jgi:hypothetical protein